MNAIFAWKKNGIVNWHNQNNMSLTEVRLLEIYKGKYVPAEAKEWGNVPVYAVLPEGHTMTEIKKK